LLFPFLQKHLRLIFAGDEKIDPEERNNLELLGQSVPSSLALLNSWWTDLPPNDNKFTSN